jgi:hypothetical protein
LNGRLYFSTVEAYDPSTNTWSEKRTMPTARASLAARVLGRSLYAMGGSGSNFTYATVEAFRLQ